MSDNKIVVCGAGGYVGRHLVADLVLKGHTNVVAVGRRDPGIPGARFMEADLLDRRDCDRACNGAFQLYNLAANVGGIGYIQANQSDCLESAAININLLQCLQVPPTAGYFFASSSCVYSSNPLPLLEQDARALNLTGYALEKYFSEQVCKAAHEEHGCPVRVARLHTVYGPEDFRGHGRDHFPSAMALAVVDAKKTGVHEIKVWGDGKQTRSLLYIDDAVEGIQRIMNGSFTSPVNLASSEIISVNGVIDRLEKIAAVKLKRFYSADAPTGAQDKTASTALLRERYNWEPMTSATAGLEKLYRSAWDRRLKE